MFASFYPLWSFLLLLQCHKSQIRVTLESFLLESDWSHRLPSYKSQIRDDFYLLTRIRLKPSYTLLQESNFNHLLLSYKSLIRVIYIFTRIQSVIFCLLTRIRLKSPSCKSQIRLIFCFLTRLRLIIFCILTWDRLLSSAFLQEPD